MIEEFAEKMVLLKREFSKTCRGTGNMHEIVPNSKILYDNERLKEFAEKNPIYYNSYRQEVSGVDCIVYEGDINEYWLSSIAQESSRAPLSPTWIVSAYLLAVELKSSGHEEIVDVGSGDGRIAFFGRSLGIKTHSLELDDRLVSLQKNIVRNTGVDFGPICADATRHDFTRMGLKKPAFCIGGLAQMGGTVLASSIIENISRLDALKAGSAFVFAGTLSQKYAKSELDAGWGPLIDEVGLSKTNTISLPTVWTFHEAEETPYIFAKF